MRIGIEYEFLLLKSDLSYCNDADMVVEYCNKKNIPVHLDCSKTILEFSGTPGSILEAFEEFSNESRRLAVALEEIGYVAVPIDAPLDFTLKSELLSKPKYDLKKKMLGSELYAKTGKIMAVHLNLDEREDDYSNLRIYNFLNIFDAVSLALSPVAGKQQGELKGFPVDSKISNLRTYVYRKLIYAKYPVMGDIQGIYFSAEEMKSDLKNEFDLFSEDARKFGEDFSTFDDSFSFVRGPVRFNKKYNTIEYRGIGSNPDIYLVFGLISLICAGVRKIERLNLSNEYVCESMLLTSDETIASKKVKYLSDTAIFEGISSGDVYILAQKLYDFCSTDFNENEIFFARYLKDNYLDKRLSMSETFAQMNLSDYDKYLFAMRIFNAARLGFRKEFVKNEATSE